MLSPVLLQTAVIALASLSVGGLVYVLVMPFMSGERKASKRVASVALGQSKSRLRSALQTQPLQMRKKQVQDTIKELEAKLGFARDSLEAVRSVLEELGSL